MDPTAAPQTVPFAVDLPLSESARRRPDFAGGIPVKLENGEEWAFPRPLIAIRPDFTGVKPSLTTWGAEFDDLVAIPTETLMDVAQKWFRIARLMLRRNYILDDKDLQILFEYRPADDENQLAWGTIMNVAYGNEVSPKAPSAG